MKSTLLEIFKTVEDPRDKYEREYKLEYILFFAVLYPVIKSLSVRRSGARLERYAQYGSAPVLRASFSAFF
jgi:hypothetical protein